MRANEHGLIQFVRNMPEAINQFAAEAINPIAVMVLHIGNNAADRPLLARRAANLLRINLAF